jgi:hypothetical protein
MQERFARFHAGFPLDDVYLGLPPRARRAPLSRNDAYLYLLALNGHQRAKEADWDVPISVATALADTMGLDAEKTLAAIEAIVDEQGKPRVVVRLNGMIRLLKYRKWQDSPEEIAELRAARAEAGRKGALAGWDKKRSQNTPHIKDARPATPQQVPSTSPAIAEQVPQQIPAEREIEREIEISISPPYPPGRRSDVDKEPDEAMVELVDGMSQVLGRVLSGNELIECQLALNQYAYLTAKDLVARAHEHQDWCASNAHPPKRTVPGFADTWRRHNDHLADIGASKASRQASGRRTGMSSLGDLLKPKEAAQ